MREHAWSPPPFEWQWIAWIADIGDLLWPTLLFVACIAWSWRTRSGWAWCATVAAMLCTLERALRPASEGWYSDFMCGGIGVVPNSSGNPFVYSVQIYGSNTGLLIISMCLLGYFAIERK